MTLALHMYVYLSSHLASFSNFNIIYSIINKTVSLSHIHKTHTLQHQGIFFKFLHINTLTIKEYILYVKTPIVKFNSPFLNCQNWADSIIASNDCVYFFGRVSTLQIFSEPKLLRDRMKHSEIQSSRNFTH